MKVYIKCPKRESAVFLSMGIEIFEAAKDDARELYKEVTNHEPQEETEGNSKDIFDYIHDETNKIYTAFLMIWEKAKEIEKLENADDSADCSLEYDNLKSMVLLMDTGVEQLIGNVLGAREKFNAGNQP